MRDVPHKNRTARMFGAVIYAQTVSFTAVFDTMSYRKMPELIKGGRRYTPTCAMPRGFTLIEVLVVIGILAILAAILFPAGMRAVDSSRSVKCLNNLRQIFLAMEGYVADNNQEYPGAYNGVTKSTTWIWDLAPYAGMQSNSMGPAPLPRTAGIFVCPAHKHKGDRSVSYAYNTFIMPQTGWGWNYRKLAVPSPSKTILLAEVDKNTDTFWPTVEQDVDRRHPGKSANYLFVDGHAENLIEKIAPEDKRWKW